MTCGPASRRLVGGVRVDALALEHVDAKLFPGLFQADGELCPDGQLPFLLLMVFRLLLGLLDGPASGAVLG